MIYVRELVVNLNMQLLRRIRVDAIWIPRDLKSFVLDSKVNILEYLVVALFCTTCRAIFFDDDLLSTPISGQSKLSVTRLRVYVKLKLECKFRWFFPDPSFSQENLFDVDNLKCNIFIDNFSHTPKDLTCQ